jgi:cell division septal protein FtsQ
MKKKTKMSKYDVNKTKERHSDFDDLNSQLGSFGIEPPKIYRTEQSKRSNRSFSNSQTNVKTSNRKKNTQKNKVHQTVDQQRKAQNKKRKQKNKFIRLFRIILVLICVIAIAVVLCLTVLFKIDTITIKGNSIYSNSEITAVLPIEQNNNLLLCDIDSAEKELEESLPYVYKAEITRKLPTTIIVNITETQTIYAVKNEDKTYTLLDENFKVLETNSAKKPEGSIVIKKLTLTSANVGMTAGFEKEQVQKDLSAMTAQIKSMSLQDEITSIYSVDINNNYMVYDGRITYKFGTTENLENKIYSALTATEKLNESNPNAKGEMTVTDVKQIYFTEK